MGELEPQGRSVVARFPILVNLGVPWIFLTWLLSQAAEATTQKLLEKALFPDGQSAGQVNALLVEFVFFVIRLGIPSVLAGLAVWWVYETGKVQGRWGKASPQDKARDRRIAFDAIEENNHRKTRANLLLISENQENDRPLLDGLCSHCREPLMFSVRFGPCGYSSDMRPRTGRRNRGRRQVNNEAASTPAKDD